MKTVGHTEATAARVCNSLKSCITGKVEHSALKELQAPGCFNVCSSELVLQRGSNHSISELVDVLCPPLVPPTRERH